MCRFQQHGYLVRCEIGRGILRRYIDEAGLVVERHRVPIVSAERRWKDNAGVFAVIGRIGEHGTTGLYIDVCRPGGAHVFVRGQQLARQAVNDVEKAVLRRLEQDLARFALPVDFSEHDLLCRRVIPAVSRRRLVIPAHPSRVRVEREYRREKEIIPTRRATLEPRPWRAVAGTDVHQVQFRVVRHAVPYGSPAAELPRAVRIPGRCSGLELGMLVWSFDPARHGIEAPGKFPGIG